MQSKTSGAESYTTPCLTALCLGLPRWAGTRKVKPIWILLKQETVSGSSITWAICKSAPRSRQITTPWPHHSAFYRPDALPAAQPTVSKHWRHRVIYHCYWIHKFNKFIITNSAIFLDSKGMVVKRFLLDYITFTHLFNSPLSRTTQVSR